MYLPVIYNLIFYVLLAIFNTFFIIVSIYLMRINRQKVELSSKV